MRGGLIRILPVITGGISNYKSSFLLIIIVYTIVGFIFKPAGRVFIGIWVFIRINTVSNFYPFEVVDCGRTQI